MKLLGVKVKLQSEREKSVWNPPLAVLTLGHLTDVDLLGLGEILIAQDENNVAGFHWLWFSIYAFDDAELLTSVVLVMLMML